MPATGLRTPGGPVMPGGGVFDSGGRGVGPCGDAARADVATDAQLSALRAAGLLGSSPGAEIERWIAALRWRTGAALAALWFVGEHGPALRAVAAEDDVVSEDETDAGHALASGYALADGEGCLVAPIHVGGELLGYVTLVDPGRAEWSCGEHHALGDAASAISTEVALRLARHDAERAQQLVVSHANVHDLIARAAPLPDVLAAVAEGIERHDPSLLVCVVLLDPTSSTLHPGAGPSLPDSYLDAIDGVVIGPNVGSCGTAAWSGELVISEEISSDPKWAAVRHIPAQAGLASCWSMPIKAPGGDVLGTLAFYGRSPRRPLPEHLGLLHDWARVVGIAIERHRATERLVHDARHDSLTGLANRIVLMEALEDALEHARPDAPSAVLFIDIDGLKRLNDTLGHDRADQVLRDVGARLTAAVPDGCLVGRLGGDEFLVVARHFDRAAAGALAVELLDTIAKPLPGADDDIITASIGIALAGSAHVDAIELLREADSAMYAAKRSGRDRCAFYDGGQRVRSGRRVGLQRELRGAETRGEVSVAYDPVIDLATCSVVGVEAIPLWHSATYGEVRGRELWRIAEEAGTVVQVGARVLREGCGAIAGLSVDRDRTLGLGVDVSVRQLEHEGFAQSVHQVLVHSLCQPEQLWLEVDEADLSRLGTVALHTIDDLVEMGVHIVLDHAGSGLSSPSGLERLPISAVKLDRRITQALPGDPRKEAIASAVIIVAQAFRCEVGAQGVDSQEQRAACAALGLQLGQGALAGPAVCARELAGVFASAPAGCAESSPDDAPGGTPPRRSS
ncbi:MAG: putative bifunctional diguanylate cyclase/phosphodiesterase [Acidimicrobiales bacterium]